MDIYILLRGEEIEGWSTSLDQIEDLQRRVSTSLEIIKYKGKHVKEFMDKNYHLELVEYGRSMTFSEYEWVLGCIAQVPYDYSSFCSYVSDLTAYVKSTHTRKVINVISELCKPSEEELDILIEEEEDSIVKIAEYATFILEESF